MAYRFRIISTSGIEVENDRVVKKFAREVTKGIRRKNLFQKQKRLGD